MRVRKTVVVMRLDEREIEKVFFRLNRLKTAVIDSSSIIYLHKSDFFHIVSAAVELFTIGQVIDETGMENLQVKVVDPPALPDIADTDRLLFATAVSMNKAMISEDRAILLKCEAEKIEYYNAYNMLVMLRLRALIDDTEFLQHEEKLLSVAHYGKFVVDYVGSLIQHMRKVL